LVQSCGSIDDLNGANPYTKGKGCVERMKNAVEIPAASRALLALGSNLGHHGQHPKETVLLAVALLEQRLGRALRVSGLYRTPAFPAGSGPEFVNAAAELWWEDTPEALLALLHEVEAAMGRTRRQRWEARIMDIDLIALGAQVLPDAQTQRHWQSLAPDQAARQTPDRLILPHPRLAERSFVLVPLADIAPEWFHPVTGLSVAQMLAARPPAERAEVVPFDAAP
jgi:2-amino-4-hydroxy-6-hydroxymethyldihydropteridine diphosphokinase